MADVESRSFDAPDETRNPPKTRVEVVRLGGSEVGRFTFEPGWRWSECVKPVVGGDSCQVDHVGYLISGRIGVAPVGGTEVELGPGGLYHIHPGHDAWVVGNEAAVALEFKSAGDYAKS